MEGSAVVQQGLSYFLHERTRKMLRCGLTLAAQAPRGLFELIRWKDFG